MSRRPERRARRASGQLHPRLLGPRAPSQRVALPEAARPEVGRTPRHLLARACHAPHRHSRRTASARAARVAVRAAARGHLPPQLEWSHRGAASRTYKASPLPSSRASTPTSPPCSAAGLHCHRSPSSASSRPHGRPTPQVPLLGSVEAQAATPRPALRRPSPDGRPPRLQLGCAAVGHHRPSLCPV
jgi:hypothetical protein